MIRVPFVPHVARLPHLVPFAGPEALERTRGKPFRAGLWANRSIRVRCGGDADLDFFAEVLPEALRDAQGKR